MKQLASKETEKKPTTWDTFEKPKPVKKSKTSSKRPVGVVQPQTREEKANSPTSIVELPVEPEKDDKLEKEIRPRRKSVISINENAATIGKFLIRV